MKHCGRAACKADLSGMRSDATWCSPACRERVRRGDKPHIALTKGRSGPSGLQVSPLKYRRELEAVIEECEINPGTAALILGLSDIAARRALSDRQRARLDGRDG